jgi:hypothetical protein
MIMILVKYITLLFVFVVKLSGEEDDEAGEEIVIVMVLCRVDDHKNHEKDESKKMRQG